MKKNKVTNLTKNKVEGCVMARIMRGGEKYQKNFSRKAYGTWPKAMAAGAEWVAEMKQELPALGEARYGNMSVRNQSGVVGVHLRRSVVKKTSGSEYEYWAWVAKWPGCEQKGGVRWNISDKLSDEDAFVLAVLTRRLKETDKKIVEAELKKIRKRKAYKEILELKMLSFA